MVTPLIEGGDVVEPLHERVLGRVTAQEITILTNRIIIPKNIAR